MVVKNVIPPLLNELYTWAVLCWSIHRVGGVRLNVVEARPWWMRLPPAPFFPTCHKERAAVWRSFIVFKHSRQTAISLLPCKWGNVELVLIDQRNIYWIPWSSYRPNDQDCESCFSVLKWGVVYGGAVSPLLGAWSAATTWCSFDVAAGASPWRSQPAPRWVRSRHDQG